MNSIVDSFCFRTIMIFKIFLLLFNDSCPHLPPTVIFNKDKIQGSKTKLGRPFSSLVSMHQKAAMSNAV